MRCVPTTSILLVMGRICRLIIQIQLSEIPKSFWELFIVFLKFILFFEHFFAQTFASLNAQNVLTLGTPWQSHVNKS